MGSPHEQEKSENRELRVKEALLEQGYKPKNVSKAMEILEMSTSRKIVGYIMIALDILMWIVIGYFAIGWWQSIGKPIGCDRVTPDLCNVCLSSVKLNVSNLLNNLNNLSLGV